MMKMTIRKDGIPNPMYEDIIGHENYFMVRVAEDGRIVTRGWTPGYPPIMPPYTIEVIEVPVSSDPKDTAANEVTGSGKSGGDLGWSGIKVGKSFPNPEIHSVIISAPACEHEGCHHRTQKRPSSRFSRRPLPCRLGLHGHYRTEHSGLAGYVATCLVCGYKWRGGGM